MRILFSFLKVRLGFVLPQSWRSSSRSNPAKCGPQMTQMGADISKARTSFALIRAICGLSQSSSAEQLRTTRFH